MANADPEIRMNWAIYDSAIGKTSAAWEVIGMNAAAKRLRLPLTPTICLTFTSKPVPPQPWALGNLARYPEHRKGVTCLFSNHAR